MAVSAPTGLKFIKGESIDFVSGFQKGQFVFVFEFWATWCPPCRHSIPHLTELQRKYLKSAVFVGITNEDENTTKEYVESMGKKMEYSVAIDAEGNASRNFMEKYGVRGIPHAFVIAKNGSVSWHGHPMEPHFEKALQDATTVIPELDPKAPRENLMGYTVSELKAFLEFHSISGSHCVEKGELVDLIQSSKF